MKFSCCCCCYCCCCMSDEQRRRRASGRYCRESVRRSVCERIPAGVPPLSPSPFFYYCTCSLRFSSSLLTFFCNWQFFFFILEFYVSTTTVNYVRTRRISIFISFVYFGKGTKENGEIEIQNKKKRASRTWFHPRQQLLRLSSSFCIFKLSIQHCAMARKQLVIITQTMRQRRRFSRSGVHTAVSIRKVDSLLPFLQTNKRTHSTAEHVHLALYSLRWYLRKGILYTWGVRFLTPWEM